MLDVEAHESRAALGDHGEQDLPNARLLEAQRLAQHPVEEQHRLELVTGESLAGVGAGVAAERTKGVSGGAAPQEREQCAQREPRAELAAEDADGRGNAVAEIEAH